MAAGDTVGAAVPCARENECEDTSSWGAAAAANAEGCRMMSANSELSPGSAALLPAAVVSCLRGVGGCDGTRSEADILAPVGDDLVEASATEKFCTRSSGGVAGLAGTTSDLAC